MAKLQELIDKRATIVTNARKEFAVAQEKAKAENRDISADEEATLDKALNASDEITKEIEAAEKAEEASKARLDRLANQEKLLKTLNRGDLQNVVGSAVGSGGLEGGRPDIQNDQANAMRGWILNNRGEDVPQECVDAGRRCGINPLAGSLDIPLATNYGAVQREFHNALSSNNPATGGLLRLGPVLGPLEQAMLYFGPMLQVAQVLRTSNANPLPWPTADDTGNTGSQVGESTDVGNATDPSFAAMVLSAYKWKTGVIKVPYELLRDSAIDLPTVLGEMLGERLGRILNTRATTGTGAATIKGIVTASTMGKTTAANNAITADELIDLQHSVPIAYRQGAAFMFNDSTFKTIRKLKSNDNQYLWQPGLVQGVPGSILGAAYYINEDIASIAASAKVALFGQLNRYKIRQVNRIRLYRLEERYREFDQDGFLAFIEADGNLLDAGKGAVRHLLMTT
jgi:HK97 family phage major capsid protein